MIWLGRTLLLILAGMATLSIIGAIAAIPGNPAPSPPERIERPSPPPPAAALDGPQAAAAGTAAGTPGQTDRGAIPVAAAVPPDRVAEALAWLRPLAYAMIALAGFAAAILVVLLRISARLGRNGD